MLVALVFLLMKPTELISSPAYLTLVMGTAQLATIKYMGSFWNNKAKVPLLDDYNNAISLMSQTIWAGHLASFCWCVMTVIYGVSNSKRMP